MSHEQVERVAAIDVGSNAIRLIVARIFREGSLRPFLRREASYRIPLRLGDDVFAHGAIGPEKTKQIIEVFQGFHHLLHFFAPVAMRACATSAMREARNGMQVAEQIQNATGISIEVISGRDEASLLFSNHLEEGPLNPANTYLYIDVGGGSTELTLMVMGKALVSESFRIGTVRMLKDKVEPEEWQRMESWIKALPPRLEPVEAIGCGGNIGKIFDLLDHQAEQRTLARKSIREFIDKIEKFPYEERMRKFDLKPDRADVIVPAGRIFLQVMQWAGTKSIHVPKVGIGDGIVNELLAQQIA